jgi:hypothetical protein
MAPMSHKTHSSGNSMQTQLGSMDTAQRKREKSKYNYSISASDIDQQTLVEVLQREFGKDFRVKVSSELYFLFAFSGLMKQIIATK